MTIDDATRTAILAIQRNERTEQIVYERLARRAKDPRNAEVLSRIARDEERHHLFWKGYTDAEPEPNRLKAWWYHLVARIFGLTFGLKLMERGEEGAQATYGELSAVVPEAQKILEEEEEHEQRLIDMIDDERLRYVGSMVLGLNDALVELTGALAGLTFALRNARLVAVAGLITGIAASLSMAASEYLSTKTEEAGQRPLKASLYTGIAYILTVILLIAPYIVFANLFLCLGLTMGNAVAVIAVFSFYVAVAREVSFRTRFAEMAAISLGVATLTFGIGLVVRAFMPIDV